MHSIPNPRMETVGFERGHLLDFYDLFSGGSFSRKTFLYTFMLNTPKTSTSTLKLLSVAIRSQQLRLWLQIDWPPPPAVYIRAFYVRHLSQTWLVCWQVISIRKIMKHPDHPGHERWPGTDFGCEMFCSFTVAKSRFFGTCIIMLYCCNHWNHCNFSIQAAISNCSIFEPSSCGALGISRHMQVKNVISSSEQTNWLERCTPNIHSNNLYR